MIGALHLVGGVRDFSKFHIRVRSLKFGDSCSRAITNTHLTRTSGAEDFKANNRLAVEQGNGTTLGIRVGYCRQTVNTRRTTVRQDDAQSGQFFDATRDSNGAYGLLTFTQSGAATRNLSLHALQCSRYIRGASPQRSQAHRVYLNSNFAVDAAHATHPSHALHTEQLLGDRTVDEPGELALV